MNDLKVIVDPRAYREFAGSSWPTYEDFVAGVRSTDNTINRELDEFVLVMTERYRDLKLGEGTSIAAANQARQEQIFFDKSLINTPRCNIPWNTLGINTNGEAFICQSPSWVPKFVGNLLDTSNVYEILNSETAKDIRREIVLNRYYYCNHRLCSFFKTVPKNNFQNQGSTIASDVTVPESELLVNQIPGELIFDFDYTCNFKCPSCRTEVINWNKHHLIRPINNKLVDKIKGLIIDQIRDQLVTIRWAGGEPFISDVYLDLLQYIIDKKKPNIQNIIQTNGSYLHSPMVHGLLPYIKELRISFDAGTEETYSKIRVNGDWKKLIRNVQQVKQMIDRHGYHTELTADFVVQTDNFREIPEFMRICQDLGIKNVNLQKMWNWGTWDHQTFKLKNVYDDTHPEYHELLEIFNRVGKA